MARPLPALTVDTVIVGNGPSSLILSYILHGRIPFYDTSKPHSDPLLDTKLRESPNLLHADVDYLTEHFGASRFSYSTQALPVNVLLDTLIRPHGDTDDIEQSTCIRWEHRPDDAIDHLVIGNTLAAGGQWVDNPVEASWDIETLSYAGMLSLPAYTFADHYQQVHNKSLPSFLRPSRREVAAYFAEYPRHAGIEDTLYCGQRLDGVSRTKEGFYIASHGISCRNLVLATGIFSRLIPPRPLLQPLLSLPRPAITAASEPLLVVGSGFSAADVIISAPKDRKIIHIYKWAPNSSPSPLRACHQQAYPDYAGVYRRMKIAAMNRIQRSRPRLSRAPSSAFEESRNWDHLYEGLPNTAIIGVHIEGTSATVTLQTGNNLSFTRKVSSLAYVVGRRGSLSYLDQDLRAEVYDTVRESTELLSGQSLRDKALASTEVAENVFIIGSLTGDSLVRFAYGGCTYAAGKIMARNKQQQDFETTGVGGSSTCSATSSPLTANQSGQSSPYRTTTGLMHGLDGHHIAPIDLRDWREKPLDRRKDD